MRFLFVSACSGVAAGLFFGDAGNRTAANLFPRGQGATSEESAIEESFHLAYGHFEKSFDKKAYSGLLRQLKAGEELYRTANAFTAYAADPGRPHCDKGVVGAEAYRANRATGISAFPGGAVNQVFGFDASKSAYDLSEQAQGPAAAGLLQPMALASQGLGLGGGLVQAAIAAVIHAAPPMIPPPIWNNQPLPCAPMVTGHNCFGAVLYPITMADFVLADVTDSVLDGIIAGFPSAYAEKVGKTSDEMYKACFSAFMSMHCSSVFPRCTVPQSGEEPVAAGGRAPMCLHLCILPLVTCPGFWISDIAGPCSMVSVPPMCAQAFYWNMHRLPPQYSTFDEANPFPSDCPGPDFGPGGMDSAEDPALYDDALPQGEDILGSDEPAEEHPLR